MKKLQTIQVGIRIVASLKSANRLPKAESSRKSRFIFSNSLTSLNFKNSIAAETNLAFSI